jgi:hypothetical protein
MRFQIYRIPPTPARRARNVLHCEFNKAASRCFHWKLFKDRILIARETTCQAFLAPALKALEDLPHSLLLGRKTVILWDIENVPPWSPTLSIPVQIHRVKAMVQGLGGSIVFILAAMNERSINKLRRTGQLEMLMISGLNILCCSSFSDAADRDLISEAYNFSRSERNLGAIVLISNDTGFCEILRYASSCGCITLSMAPHKLRKTEAVMLPRPQLHKAQLPGACHAAVMWQALPLVPSTAEEQQFLKQCVDRVMSVREEMMSRVAGMLTGEASCEEDGHDVSSLRTACTHENCVGWEGRILKPSLQGLNAIHVQVMQAQRRLPSWKMQPMPGAVTQAWLNQAQALPPVPFPLK